MRYQITEYRPVVIFQTEDEAEAKQFWEDAELEEAYQRGGQFTDTQTGTVIDEWF